VPSRLLLGTFKNATLILKAHITHDYYYIDGYVLHVLDMTSNYKMHSAKHENNDTESLSR